ncbi:class I SAM-dependent methyltransferase [Flavicella sediminum]|uniref:class I SAM-dependent methyltransferase n=1 Tax=Flavicella sediminum TaxID=2585141 RepID=UPI00112118B5|nr:class I SAM-dependent methyltransferase [Flavicella sediminum]
MSSKKDWFTDWFNTKYYHILYQHRDDYEAQVFMNNLVRFLNISKGSSILDLACGKGRHSIYLNTLGYNVTGADLSINSIKHASLSKNESLNFIVQDMRLPFPFKKDVVFNLFTSFGYFADDQEDIRVLENIKNCLNKDGVAVLDYLNVTKAIKNLVAEEEVTLDGIVFKITKEVKNGFIIKKIEFTAEDGYHSYFERVKCLDLAYFESYVAKAGLKIKHCFGDYNLNGFDIEKSNRLILVLE